MNPASELSKTRKLLDSASKRLDQLQSDLPTFKQMLEQALSEEATLKQNKPTLTALGNQKIKVMSARELLEQQESDIESERAQVAKLTSDIKMLEPIMKIAETEKELSSLQSSYCQDLTHTLEQAYKGLSDLTEKRKAWFELREKVKAEFQAVFGIQWKEEFVYSPDKRAAFYAGLDKLASYGIDVKVLTNIPDYSRGKEDIDTYPAMAYPAGFEEIAETYQLSPSSGQVEVPLLIRVAKFLVEFMIYRKSS